MSEKILNKEAGLEELIKRQKRLTASYDGVKKELATRKKTLDTLKKKIEAEREKQYLHNMKELGQIVISHFGETFSQNDCKDMLEYIFAIGELQEFISIQKEGQTEIQTEVIIEESISANDNNEEGPAEKNRRHCVMQEVSY